MTLTPTPTLDLFRQLSATSKRSEKEQALFAAFMEGERAFFTLARLAYDPLISFGVKKVALIEEDDGDPGTLTFDEFLALAHKLRRRELTGHAARDAILDAASRCHAPTWNEVYRRVLLRDLDIGVTESTVNKVLNKLVAAEPEARDHLIPVFGAQLAHDGNKPEHQKKIKGEKYLDVKFDGVRLFTFLDKEAGTITQYSREGQVLENFTAIRDSLRDLLTALPGSVVLDGEVIGRNFQDLMTQVQRTKNVDTQHARLALFDVIPMGDFLAGECKKPQRERHAVLCQLETSGLRQSTNGLVFVVPKVLVDLDSEDGQAQLARFNKEALEAGYEGVMVKDPDAPYKGNRNASWLKIKPWIEASLTVVEVQEGKADGKYVGQMGGLLCRGEDDGKEIEVVVGSGFSDEQRKEFWERRDDLVGMIAEVRADALTLEKGSTVYSMRFPRWKGWRGRKPGEKL